MVCLCFDWYFFKISLKFKLLGNYLFAYLKPQAFITDDINFRDIFLSLFTLFRIATSEGWFFILADTARSESVGFICRNIADFQDYQLYGLVGCGTKWAYPFFYSFIILILLIFNLIVGEMLNASAELKEQQDKAINVYQLDDIVKLWGCFDSEGSGFMNYKDFWKFSSKIAKILGVQTQDVFDIESKKKFLELLELPVYEYVNQANMFCFSFYDVVLALSKIIVIIKLNLQKFLFFATFHKIKK